MRVMIIASAVMLVLGTILSMFVRESTNPMVVVEPRVADLGSVSQAAKHPFAFRVTNPTRRPITVLALAKSCGCTLLDEVNGATIDPGRSLTIRGALSTIGRRGKHEVHAVLTYRGADQAKPSNSILTVRAEVLPTILFTPDAVRFEAAGTGPTPVRVDVSPVRVAKTTLGNFVTSASWLTARVVRPEAHRDGRKDRSAVVEVTLDRDRLREDANARSRPNQWVRVQTSAENEPVLNIPVHVQF